MAESVTSRRKRSPDHFRRSLSRNTNVEVSASQIGIQPRSRISYAAPINCIFSKSRRMDKTIWVIDDNDILYLIKKFCLGLAAGGVTSKMDGTYENR